MVFLVKGFAQKEEGEAKDAVVVAETLSVAVGELCLDLGFLLGCAGNGVYFVAGGREGAGYLESVFFFKACKEREEGVPPAYAVGFLQEYACERYHAYNERLMFDDREQELLGRI